MGGSEVLGKIEMRVPLGEAATREAICEFLPAGEDAWARSNMGQKVNGRTSKTFIHAYRDIDESIVIVHSQGERQERSALVTALDIRIEPAPGVSARRAAEAAWRAFADARPLIHNGQAPRLVSASVVSAGQDILSGTRTATMDVLRLPEFRLPSLVGVAAALLVVGLLWLPDAQRPSALWTAAQLAVPAFVALTLGFTLRSKEAITWEVV
jgi:hypothetical protein